MPHLDCVFIPHVDAEIGFLIASDVLEALDPVEIRHSKNGGSNTSTTRIGWAVNGPLGLLCLSSSQLQLMVENFYSRDSADSYDDDDRDVAR